MIDLNPEPQVAECDGQIFKGRISTYTGARGEYVCQKKMVPMKRLSCKGCESCGFLLDNLSDAACGGYNPPNIDHAEDGSLYTLKVTNISRDWETDFVEDWDLEFIKIEEPDNNDRADKD